jgi:hypothetical protein
MIKVPGIMRDFRDSEEYFPLALFLFLAMILGNVRRQIINPTNMPMPNPVNK